MSFGSKKSATKTGKQTEDVDFLLKTIDEQNENITRLQNKFRDVTHAYKSLLAEKQALEITLKALKAKPALAQTNKTKSDVLSSSGSATSSPQTSRHNLATDTASDASENESKYESNNSQSNNEDKIAALTANIHVLMENKSKMELNYQAEKKKLRSDYQELKETFENYRNDVAKQNETNEIKLKELRVSLKQSQAEREKLTQDLNNMIKLNSTEQENKILSLNEENQALLLSLRNENNELKFKIKNITKQFENKCEELVHCENDLKKIKLSHEEQIKYDEQQLFDLRSQLKEATESSERRISDLEANMSQLCSTIAIYESNSTNKNFNSNTHASLKAKTIEEDNDFKLKTTSSGDKQLDFDQAIEQITYLKNYIETTAKELNMNFNFNEIWLQDKSLNQKQEQQKRQELERDIEKLKDENRHLREEYEKYKIRTNYLIKSAKQTTKELTNNVETEQQHQQQINKLKEEVDILKKRLILLEKEKQEDIINQKELHEKNVKELTCDFKLQLEKCEHDRLKSLNDLEKELIKQRERTLKLLKEKDTEIEHMRNIFSSGSQPNTPTLPRNKSRKNSSINGDITNEHQENDIDSLEVVKENVAINLLNNNDSTVTPNRILHYSQQTAYRDIELNKLRLAKSDLEYRLKQTYDEHSVDIDRLQSQISLLKEEIERLKLNQSRYELNGENLEYIKNVIYNYLTTKDTNVKISMINAIMQILKFTKNEKQKLQLSIQSI